MSTSPNVEEAVQLLQELGLREYEARCFVGLIRSGPATAKELADLTDVPRTRVYDAVRVLESTGLVEVHHSSPRQFHPLSLEAATEVLRDQHDTRVRRLRDSLETVASGGDTASREWWSITGSDAIEDRAEGLVEGAASEVLLVLCAESVASPEHLDALWSVDVEGDLLVGSTTEPLHQRVRSAVPEATTFVTRPCRLRGDDTLGDDTAIGRLLLVDRSTLLASSIDRETSTERAIHVQGVPDWVVEFAHRLVPREVPGEPAR